MSTPDGSSGWPASEPPRDGGWPATGPEPSGPPPPAGYPPAGYPPSPGYGPGGYAPQPGFPPAAYPGYGYGYGPPPYAVSNDHPQGILVLVLGICGIVICQLLGPVAWIMGNKALADIDSHPGVYSNRSLVNAGRICGIVGTVFLVLVIGFYAVFFVAIAASSGGA